MPALPSVNSYLQICETGKPSWLFPLRKIVRLLFVLSVQILTKHTGYDNGEEGALRSEKGQIAAIQSLAEYIPGACRISQHPELIAPRA